MSFTSENFKGLFKAFKKANTLCLLYVLQSFRPIENIQITRQVSEIDG